ncbi:hypothetical protein GCM10027294_24950 [Marinactinospora endophytica]
MTGKSARECWEERYRGHHGAPGTGDPGPHLVAETVDLPPARPWRRAAARGPTPSGRPRAAGG